MGVLDPLTPQEQEWTDELDREGWSYADIMRQRDEARAEAVRLQAALDRARAVPDSSEYPGSWVAPDTWEAGWTAAILQIHKAIEEDG